MRIQYRNRRMVTDHSVYSGYSQRFEWGPWQDTRISNVTSAADIPVVSVDLGTQVRIVDDNGNAVQLVPPFTPAYYQRKTRLGRPGGLAWMTSKPNHDEWIRRDDVQPK